MRPTGSPCRPTWTPSYGWRQAGSHPVTEADQGVERALRTLLATASRRRSTRREYGALGHSADRCWIIDPIDGTANFLRGVPVWATLIGLVVDGAATLGVVSALALGRRWWAADGQARTSDVNGRVRRLRTSAVSEWSDASLAYSDPIGWAPGALGGWPTAPGARAATATSCRTCWWRRARSMWRSGRPGAVGRGGAAAHRGGRRRLRQRHDRRRRDRLG